MLTDAFVVEGLRDDPFRARPKQPTDLGAIARPLEILEINSEPGPGPSAWVDREIEAKLDPGQVDKARPAIAQVGAGALPLDAPPDDIEIPSPSGRDRSTGVQLDSGGDKPKPADLPPIKTGGMTEAQVKAAATKIDSNLDGVITHREVRAYGDKVRAAGVSDRAALAAFRRHEAGAALAATQGDVKGRQFTHEYLEKDFARELGKLGANAAEIGDTKRVILPQVDSEIAPDAVADLRAAADPSFDVVERDAARGCLRLAGDDDGFVVDRNDNGRFDAFDKVAIKNKAGEWRFEDLGARADEMNGVVGINRVPTSGQKFAGSLDGSQDKWFPTDQWQWNAKNSEWKLKDGVKPSDAIEYYRNNPTKFTGDCAAMRQLAGHSALLEQLGPELYNDAVKAKGLSIGFGARHDKAGLSSDVRELGDSGYPSIKKYQPGWHGYVPVDVTGRPDANKALLDAGWAGEHFITTVDRDGTLEAVAHPFGRVPLADLEKKVRAEVASTLDAAQVFYEEKDVKLGMQQPRIYDANKARAIARP